MSTLIELAERVERATDGCSDAEMAERQFLNSAIHDLQPEPKVIQPLDYCRSLDAAMTLVEGRPFELAAPLSSGRIHAAVWSEEADNFKCGSGATPALALCAASLRARAAAPQPEKV